MYDKSDTLTWADRSFRKGTNTMATSTDVLTILERVTGTDQVRHNLDLALFDLDILDSLGTVELIVALSEKFGVEISPAEIERQQWANPRKIIAYMEGRVGP
jgi:D-alanine--poly(phosphoribitol) ligase subunit 2